MAKRSEKQIENSIRAVLRRNGWVEEKNHQTALNKGRPDLHVAHPKYGEAWVEVKRPGGKLRPEQVTWLLKWEGCVLAVVCDDESQVLDLLHAWRGVANPREQWRPYCAAAQRARLDGRDTLAEALSEFGSEDAT